MSCKKEIEGLYKKLRKKHGKPQGQWKLWCKRPKTAKEKEEVAIGAILTQRTNWKNVELAINNLKKACLPAGKAKASLLKDILKLKPEKLETLIKPSGFYKTKAQYLLNLAKFIVKNYSSLEKMGRAELMKLRKELLVQKGIGPETADSILLYALDKPIFVIDEYTRRLVKNYNLSSKTDYYSLQKLFEENLKKDFKLYQDLHALIVINAKNSYQKNNR